MVLLSFLSSPAVVCCQVFWIKVRRRSCSLCFGEVRRQLFDRAPLGEDPHTRAPNKVTFVGFLFVGCEADCQNKSQQMKNCIILLASNNVGNKNAFVTQQLSALLPQTFAWDSFGASNKKSGAFRKTGTNAPPLLFPTTLSFLFNVLATSFLCFSSPVPASHYKYDEHTAAANPPLFPLIAQAPCLSFAIAEALLSPSWTTQKGFNQIL